MLHTCNFMAALLAELCPVVSYQSLQSLTFWLIPLDPVLIAYTLSYAARAEATEGCASQDQEQGVSSGESEAQEGVCRGTGETCGALHTRQPAAEREGGFPGVKEQVISGADEASPLNSGTDISQQDAGRHLADGTQPHLLSTHSALGKTACTFFSLLL